MAAIRPVESLGSVDLNRALSPELQASCTIRPHMQFSGRTRPVFRHLVCLMCLLAWVPVAAFAPQRLTLEFALAIGGPTHPALPQPEDRHYEPLDPALAVVDAASFWHAVESYEEPTTPTLPGHGHAALPWFETKPRIALPGSSCRPDTLAERLSSRSVCPELPPPRL
ncbi:MAG: hypothetical protein NZ533_07345 [Casimicrobiaceae bacterium]|nr:hypothetical protein [Casimicrobiaceae bacterium]